MSKENIPHKDFLGQELKQGDLVAYISRHPTKLCKGVVIGLLPNTIKIAEHNSKGELCKSHNGSLYIRYIPFTKIVRIHAVDDI